MVRLAAATPRPRSTPAASPCSPPRVGDELKLPASARRHLAVGGLLHDIGKLAVPLRDPAEAGRADRRGVRRDQAPPGRRPAAARGARRLPGRGPPARLRPSRAPRRPRLPARPDRRRAAHRDRILAVCDVYDALVSDRVYRAAWTPERAFGAAARGGARLRPGRGRGARAARSAARRTPAPGWVADLSPAPPTSRAAPPHARRPRPRTRSRGPHEAVGAGDLRDHVVRDADVGRDRHHREVVRRRRLAPGGRPRRRRC